VHADKLAKALFPALNRMFDYHAKPL